MAKKKKGKNKKKNNPFGGKKGSKKKQNNPYGGKKGSRKPQPISRKQSQAMFRDAMGITNQYASKQPFTNPGRPGQNEYTGGRKTTASLQDRILYGSNADSWKNIAKTLGLRPDQTGKSATTKMAQYVLANPGGRKGLGANGTQVGGGGGGGGGAGGTGSGSNARNTGEYDDILSSMQDDIQAGKDAAADLAARQVEMGNYEARFGQLESLMNQSLTTGLEDMLMAQGAGYEEQIAQQNEMYNQQIQGMESQFAMANSFMNQQLQSANAALGAAERRATNMATAFVPQANPTALSVQYGDARSSTRKKENNQLSDLTILSGLGSTSNPLAGLQLA